MGFFKDFMRRFNRIENILEDLKGMGCRVVKTDGPDGRGWRIVVDGDASDEVPKQSTTDTNNHFVGPCRHHKCDGDMYASESESAQPLSGPTDHLTKSIQRHDPQTMPSTYEGNVFTPHCQLFEFDDPTDYVPYPAEDGENLKVLVRAEANGVDTPSTLRYVEPGKILPPGNENALLMWNGTVWVQSQLPTWEITFVAGITVDGAGHVTSITNQTIRVCTPPTGWSV